MPVSLASAAVLGWLLSVAPSQERVFSPCAPDTSDWRKAGEGLAALDAQVEALAEDGDVRDARTAMRALLASRCFALAREESRRPTDKGVSALALKVWWRDGGKAWLASYLELGGPGPREVVLPPDVRSVLTPDSASDHRLAALLCPAKDKTCGTETEAWRTRAERAFRPEPGRHRESSGTETKRPDCSVLVAAKPKRWRYTAWRSCLGESGSRPRQVALPLGRFRSPEDGWLVIRGRRGHYGFCDEVRAYHLRTGSAYVSKSCGDLMLMEGGGVDAARTDAARQGTVSGGRMAPALLRELTWMLLLGPEVQRDVQVEAWRVPVPAGYRVERRELLVDDGSGVEVLGGGATGWFHTGQTRLRWTWFPPRGAEPLSGELTYPDSSWVEVDHANVLLREAEATFEEGCPSERVLPTMLDFTWAPGVNGRDAPEGVTKAQDTLVEALRAWRAPLHCGPGLDGEGVAN
ncbi:hypothetical protein [Melittangium boletus]|uniref:Uncharacterized protein n=1 Tax=Melittangium boletus DSM 14713 TaxID=1294270 RepID=A0A250I8T4_9BACT|nr:hypothetical protein [Melittangium boletus]ATB27620.1 hypothetical protein MEBOL_001064 [Melittangium boletus DSM 14713]